MELPSGRPVSKSILESYTDSLVKYGKRAILPLSKWVMADNLAIRYVAIHALEKITGIKYDGYYFWPDESGVSRGRSIHAWLNWAESNCSVP